MNRFKLVLSILDAVRSIGSRHQREGESGLDAVKIIGGGQIEDESDILYEINNVNRVVREMTEQNIRHGLDEYKREATQS